MIRGGTVIRGLVVVVVAGLLLAACGDREEERVAELRQRAVVLLDAVERAIGATPDGPITGYGPRVGICDRDIHRIDYRSTREGLSPEQVRTSVDVVAAELGGEVRPQDRNDEGGAGYGVVVEGLSIRVSANVGQGFVSVVGSTGCYELEADVVRAVLDDVRAEAVPDPQPRGG